MRFLILFLLASCYYGVSPARATMQVDVYCEPLAINVQVCRDDVGHAWRCVDAHGWWQCEAPP